MKNLGWITIITLLLLTAGCKKDSKILSKDYPYIILDKVSDISETGVSVYAEVISSGEYSIDDFGFVISTKTKPVITDRKISLKSVQSNPDKLPLRIDNDLVAHEQYYIRAYIKTDRYLVYSNEESFNSMGCMTPRIDHLSITSGIPGNVVTISGNYFSETPGHNIVRFANVKAPIIREFKDRIVVQCPNTSATQEVPVSVEVAGQTGYASAKFNLVNPWVPLADFPGGSRFWSSFFTVGNKGYITLGLTDVNSYATKELWEFNSLTNQWGELTDFPGQERGKAIAFTIGNSGFVGLGLHSSSALNNELTDLWEYNTQSNTWLKKADFPGSTTGIYPHFVIDNKLYLYTSFNSHEFWSYDPGMDIWTELPSDPQLLQLTINEGFSVENTGYFIEKTGVPWGIIGLTIWQFDPLKNTFFKIDSLSTNSIYIEDCSFNIGKKLFLSARYRALIEYDMDSKLFFYHNHPSDHQRFNFSFVFDNKAIVNNSETPKIFEFNIDAALHSK